MLQIICQTKLKSCVLTNLHRSWTQTLLFTISQMHIYIGGSSSKWITLPQVPCSISVLNVSSSEMMRVFFFV
ncbi:unnamed protein product [Heterobilharzia americana]|nr:unnamed protein product [Heterobilharzia americana]